MTQIESRKPFRQSRNNLNGTRLRDIKLTFTIKSAIASDSQRGAEPKRPRIGADSVAQEISLTGSKKVKEAEKAIEKNSTVSKVDPKNDEIRGAFHQF